MTMQRGKERLARLGDGTLTGEILSAETQKLVERMKRDGYEVYETSGKTPVDIKAEGMKFWYLDQNLKNVSAALALVAFKSRFSEFFLEGSKSLSFKRQLELLREEKTKVKNRYPNSGLIVRVGKLSEWVELSWKHFQATGKGVRLFGEDYGYNLTWTDTCVGAHRARFGGWDEAYGASAGLWDSRLVGPGLAPLVEIPRK